MPRIILFTVVLLFQANATVIYMNGDYSSVEYHLGVLSEIERFQIPIDTIVGSEWGAFAGALWSAGWSSMQIRDLIKSWDSLPHIEQPQKAALWQKEWLIKHKENGSPFLVEINENKPYFGQDFFDLRVQESLWRSNIGSKTPFRQIDSLENYPFPPSNGEQGSARILSTSIALRDTNGTAAELYQQKLWREDSTLLILRPHSKPNPDSLFEAGIQAVQSKRSRLAQIPNSPAHPDSFAATPLKAGNFPPPPRFLYHPVFDSIPAEIQGHLKTFWNPGDTGILAVRNFLENLQKDGSYREVNLVLDSSSFLQINSESDPQLSLALIGFGGTLFGANIAANANFRFVNQFGYNLNLMAFYGQGTKGVEPNLRFERFFMGNGDFFAKAKFYEVEPISFFQKRIYEKARLLKESGGGITLGIEKERLQIAVEIERRDITSGASGIPVYDRDDFFDDEDEEPEPIAFIYEPVGVSSMFPYARWLWQSEGYDRWFAKEGFMVLLKGGFKAVSVHSFDQEAPLYVSSQGILSITHSLNDYISISGGTEFGANFRRTDRGKFVLPSELYGLDFWEPDPALGNRYRFAMGMGSYMEGWQAPDNSSNLYGLVHAGISLQWQGSGIFLAGGFAKDGETNPWSEMGAKRLFTEPKIRIKMQTFDFVLGCSQIFSLGNYANIAKRGENHIFLSLQSEFLN
jgi:NTE family protein